MALPAGQDQASGSRVGDDLVLPFRTVDSRAQGQLVRLGPAVDEILARHACPDAVSEALGRAVALTAMLGSLVHANSRLILQTKTDGPLRQIVSSFTAPGNMRALASFDEVRIAEMTANGRISEGPLIGSGHLAMTIDPGNEEPRTQGIVAVSGQGLAEAAHDYFRQSEQIPTLIRVAVARHAARQDGLDRGWHWRAGGLIIQQLPSDVVQEGVRGSEDDDDRLLGEQEEDWQRVRMLAATVEDHELIDPTLSPEQLLYRLFHEEGVRVMPIQPIRAHCGCTRDRVEGLLKSFGADELSDMREADGAVTVTCEYCSTRYRFVADEVARL